LAGEFGLVAVSFEEHLGERIDKLTGVEAPTKAQREVRHMDFSKLSDEDLQTFERIIRENFPELLESPED
jgi:hypothetical protein